MNIKEKNLGQNTSDGNSDEVGRLARFSENEEDVLLLDNLTKNLT